MESPLCSCNKWSMGLLVFSNGFCCNLINIESNLVFLSWNFNFLINKAASVYLSHFSAWKVLVSFGRSVRCLQVAGYALLMLRAWLKVRRFVTIISFFSFFYLSHLLKNTIYLIFSILISIFFLFFIFLPFDRFFFN